MALALLAEGTKKLKPHSLRRRGHVDPEDAPPRQAKDCCWSIEMMMMCCTTVRAPLVSIREECCQQCRGLANNEVKTSSWSVRDVPHIETVEDRGPVWRRPVSAFRFVPRLCYCHRVMAVRHACCIAITAHFRDKEGKVIEQ